MMFLVNADREGLVILPTHRLLHGLKPEALAKLREEAPKFFSIKRFPKTTASTAWLAAIERTTAPAFGLVTHDEPDRLLLELKDPAAYLDSIRENATDEWKRLDVNVLNRLVLSGILGISEEMMSLQANVEYCKGAEEAMARVASEEMQAAFILKSTPLSSVLAVAEAGEKMPRKSTFFYPKPLSGLVFYEMQ